MTHSYDWTTPSPFWESNSFRRIDFFRPALLEYRSDDFMELFLAAAAAPDPALLRSARLQTPSPGNDSQPPARLFQPAHGCFYLTAASLCCRQPGFPDRRVHSLEGENAFFVLRKLSGGTEYAWAGTDESRSWQPVGGSGRTLVQGEERRPVFPVPTANGRTLYAGYIPVSGSATYNVPAKQLVVHGEPLDLPIEELMSRFTRQLPGLKTLSSESDSSSEDLPIKPTDIVHVTSVYLLLDLWEYFDVHLPDVAAALRDAPNASFSGDKAAAKADLMNTMKTLSLSSGLSLADALQKAALNQDNLNTPSGADLASLKFTRKYNLANLANAVDIRLYDDLLVAKVRAALPDRKSGLNLPRGLDPSGAVSYILRFVCERPQCDLSRVLVSQPSQPFVFASFFDSEAPVRPVRIILPEKVNMAALRKFKKGVTFVMSDAMRKKMNLLLGKEAKLFKDPPLSPGDGDSGSFAFVCSFSFEIIFIVAFMLLLTFVVIFNFIFMWLPFFKICLPIPKSLFPED